MLKANFNETCSRREDEAIVLLLLLLMRLLHEADEEAHPPHPCFRVLRLCDYSVVQHKEPVLSAKCLCDAQSCDGGLLIKVTSALKLSPSLCQCCTQYLNQLTPFFQLHLKPRAGDSTAHLSGSCT